MQVSIVILNWNGRKWLEKFLPDVVRHCPEYAVVWVVDNGSDDDSLIWLKKNHPDVRRVELDGNYGYAGGYNKGLRQIEANYYILLNSDVAVTPGWVDPLVEFMQADAKVAAVQPKVLSYSQPEYFEYAGAAGGLIDRFGYPFCRGRVFNTTEKDHGQYNDPAAVFWTTGACMMIRADVFHAMGGLDERFFAHMEEIDLCWRIQNAGYKLFAVPESVVYHVGGGSLEAGNPRKTFLNYRNNLLMLAKNLPLQSLFPTLFARLILDAIAAVRELGMGKGRTFLAIFRAHLAFLTMLPYVKRSRQQRANFTPLHKLRGVYKGSIVWVYFIKPLFGAPG